MPLDYPVAIESGGQNNAKLTDKIWNDLVDKNPRIVWQISLWKSMYVNHLRDCKNFSDIRIRTLCPPWGVFTAQNLKCVDSNKTFVNFKIDKKSEDKYPPDVRCRYCVCESKRCSKCDSTFTSLNKNNPQMAV